MTNHATDNTSGDHGTEGFDPASPDPREPDTDAPIRGGLPRWVPLAVGFVAVIAFLGFLSASAGNDDDGPTALDEFTFQTMDGDTVTLADFEGPLVVNYFAAWCPPCRAEMPEFETVSRETAGEVTFVGISRDNITDSWRSLIDETGVTFPTVYEGNVQGSFAFIEGTSMPTTLFVAADGTVAQTWSGALTDDKLRELIAEHLT